MRDNYGLCIDVIFPVDLVNFFYVEAKIVMLVLS